MKPRMVQGIVIAGGLLLAGTLADRTMAGARRATVPRPPQRALAAANAALALAAARAAGAAAGRREVLSGETVARWRWLKGTTWYVPASNLLAFVFLGEQQRFVPVSDQTVYQISDYRDGYFTGRTVVALGDAPVQCLTLVGSVTPEGRVLLTFVPRDPGEDAVITQGVGEMRQRFGQWSMENQMTSGGSASAQVAHWAYMLQTRPGEASRRSLPGSGASVPRFMRQCQGSDG